MRRRRRRRKRSVGKVKTGGDNRRRRHRRYRENILNQVEEEIVTLRSMITHEEDTPLWKQKEGVYTTVFSSKKTWLQLRSARPVCEWSKGIWFQQSTPKFSFLVWVALRQRLQTCDRMQRWSVAVDPVCVLCNAEGETCNHLFFDCKYSTQVWKALVGGILQGAFTSEWNGIVGMVSKATLSPTKHFLLRYAFQATVHALWRERNNRRHGEQPRSADIISKFVDKTIRLKLLSVKGLGHKHFEDGLITWFATRESRP